MSVVIAGILLAAGNAQRFGANKLLVPLRDATTVAQQSARRLIAAMPVSVAVIKSGDVVLRRLFEACGLRVVECAQAASGMGASIACGVAATRHADGWVIALADMPWVQAATIYAIAQSLRGDVDIVAPRIGEQRGHPVAFAARLGNALTALRGDRGARDLIDLTVNNVLLIQVEDRGTVADIDVPADIELGRDAV